jgi:hypothetical protein
MKFKIIMMLVVLVGIAITPMIMKGEFDPMSFFGGGLSEFEKLKAKAPKGLSSVVTDEKIQVYKWRDKNGVMQFSNTPPPNSIKGEKVELNPNSNIIQAIKVENKETVKKEASIKAPSPYSVKGMKKVMDDARGVEDLLKNRHENQQEMLKNL